MGGLGLSGVGSYAGYGSVMHWGHNDWRNVVLPAIPLSHHYSQGMSYMVRGLDPDQHYEATVQSRWVNTESRKQFQLPVTIAAIVCVRIKAKAGAQWPLKCYF